MSLSEQQRVYIVSTALRALKLVQAEPTLQRVMNDSPFATTVDEVSVLLDMDREVVDACRENLAEIGLVA